MGVKHSNPSNHGTLPKPFPNRSFARSFPSAMATATASSSPSATQQRYKSSQSSKSPFAKVPPPVAAKTTAAANVTETPMKDVIDLDEPWIVELQNAMEQELKSKADLLYKELLDTYAKAGPFIENDKANALQADYQKELAKVRDAHQEEVNRLVEMERQYRLWSLGAEDPEWEVWGDLREEQIIILDNIQKMAGIYQDEEVQSESEDSDTANDNDLDDVERQVRETAQEFEQVSRSFAEWQRTEPQRVRSRAQWHERMKESKIKDRRQRDFADSEAQYKLQQNWSDRVERLATEARLGGAAVRGNPPLSTFFANGETFATWRPSASATPDTPSRVSFADSWSSDTSFNSSDTTPASSVYFNPLDSPPPRHSNARPIPLHPPDERNRFSSGSGYYSGGSGFEERQRTPYGSFSNSNSSRMHGAGHTPSPTPPSNMPSSNPSHAKSGLAETTTKPEIWIPPDMNQSQHHPQKKPSMQFDPKSSKEAGGPTRTKSALFGESPAPPHPPIPEETSKLSSSSETHYPQRPMNNNNYTSSSSSTLNLGTTTDHHTAAAPRSASYSYSISGSASASSTGAATSGPSVSASAVPPVSTSTPSSTNRVPSSSYQAPPAPGLRSKPLPQQPLHQTPTPTPGPASASSSSSSTTTKPSYPSTHTPLQPQRHHTVASQPSPTEPKSFHSQPTRSFSASSSGSSFSTAIPSFGTKSSSTSATAAVPPTSPIEDATTSRSSSATASTSFASQATSQTKSTTSAAHSAAHATQTSFNKVPQPSAPIQSAQSQNSFPSTEEFRTKLRQQYVGDEHRRAEEERFRREEEERRKQEQQEEERRQKEQEINERRAAEAKRRGEERRRDEERRRQEEMARDAERREQERKARKAAAAAAGAAGMSGSYPGAGFAFGGTYGTSMPGSTSGAHGSGTAGSTSSSMPGASHHTSSGSTFGSYSSAGANVTSPSTPEPSSSHTVPEVWDAYEKQWAAMAKVSHLRFRSMPWPVLIPITNPEQLIPIRIAQFIFHAQHSQGKSKERRLREALLKWHPDRFDSKWLPKVVSEDREKVADGAGRVVRALNELLNGLNSNGFGE